MSTAAASLIPFLKSLGPFAGLTPSGLAALLRVVETREFADGAKIIGCGDPGNAMYIVQTGEVRIVPGGPDGTPKTVAKLTAGSFIGEMALVTGEPQSADAFAVGPTRTIVIKKDVFEDLSHKVPSLAKFLTDIIATRLSTAEGLALRQVGKYKLFRQVGKGEKTITYEGEDPENRRRVAVKMVNHRLALDERYRSFFERDAQVMVDLDHENIARVHDVVNTYSTYFVIMEFVENATQLSKRLKLGALRAGEARDILAQLCRALECAHRRGLVHRAVEPSNVLMAKGRVKLADFGIAPYPKAGSPYRPEEFGGRPEYMAPEILRGERADARSDIYSLGAIAFHMLAGESPPARGGAHQATEGPLAEPFAALRARRPGVPLDLLEFVGRATRIEPEARFQSAEEAEKSLASGEDDAPPLPPEARVVTLFFRPSDAPKVEAAIEQLRRALEDVPGLRFGVANPDPR
jgi:serine/threonine protein kinase